jgi:CDP-paratose 2-epimerase
MMYEFCKAPRAGEVYNLGGGKGNSCSILEAFTMAEETTGKKQRFTYVEQNRAGDHICYYSDLRKIESHFPGWRITKSLRLIVEEIAASWTERLSGKGAVITGAGPAS